jgi:N-acetylmuramic acid 6-phosphate etherase
MSLDRLQTEARNPASTHLDVMAPLEIVRLMNREDGYAVEAVASQADVIARAIEVVAERLGGGGRLIYGGAGTSGRLGVLDATECPPTFNAPPGQVVGIIAGGPAALTRAVEGAEDHPEFGEQDLKALNVSANDVFVGIATSGRTPYVIGACRYARSVGAPTIGLVCNAESELDSHVDLMIRPVVGPEVLSGSTRLKAGTATKLVLNMLSTGAMVRLGKCFGNLMVDLRATNTKLRERTNRIVRIITGLDSADADALLRRCDGELKTALVAHRAHLLPNESRALLQHHGGRVTDALRAYPPAEGTRYDDDLVIGVDGGGSSTVALVASQSAILGRGESGPSNLYAVGEARAFQALDEALAAAFVAAGRSRAKVRAAVLGLAGADRPADADIIHGWAERSGLAQHIEVINDAVLLLAAGTPDGWGVGLVAGTGSIAFSRAPDGRTARAGGWGHLLGDEGSGYGLALAGLRAAAQAADGRGPVTTLTDLFLHELGVSEPMDLIPAVYRGGRDRAALAALAPVVLEAGLQGDAIAREIVREAADQLARAVAAAATAVQLRLTDLPLAITGGTLLGSDNYRQTVLHALTKHGVRPDPVQMVHEPAEGGVRLAWAAEVSTSPIPAG